MIIIDNPAWITFQYNDNSERLVLKSSISEIKKDKNEDRLTIPLASERSQHTPPYVHIFYESVTSPVTADIDELKDLLAAYAASGVINLVHSATGTFTDGDLVGGKLTISHMLGSATTMVVIKDPSELNEVNSSTYIDDNTVEVDFGGSIGAGTFTWTVFAA